MKKLCLAWQERCSCVWSRFRRMPRSIRKPTLSISVLSLGRADLVSGGSALVAIVLPRVQPAAAQGHGRWPERHARLRVPQGRGFRGRFVTGLAPGPERPSANAAQRMGRSDHAGQPPGQACTVLAGPQLHPWVCESGATDAQVRSHNDVHVRVHVDQPVQAGVPVLQPAEPTVRRREDDDRRGGHGAVHRANRDRLHGSRPVPDHGPVPRPASPARAGRAPASVRSQAADPAVGLGCR